MKPTKTLKIKKITLRDLDESEREAIAGGGPSNIFTACATCFSCATRCATCIRCS